MTEQKIAIEQKDVARLNSPMDDKTFCKQILDTLWWTNIATEHGPFIVSFPMKNCGFPLLC